MTQSPEPSPIPVPRRSALRWWGLLVLSAAAGFGIAAVLISILERKQEAREPFVRVVEVDELSTDSEPWGRNWPHQYDGYRRTVDDDETEYGGSNALPESHLAKYPWMKRLYAGYAFSIDYREARGHAYMLHDQEVTERVTKKPQAGACLHCHASIIPTYRRLGLEALGQPADAAALAGDFQWPAVMKGFEVCGSMTYFDAHAELVKTPDGTPATTTGDPHAVGSGGAHPVGCVDCHDPRSMQLRITRPGFVHGIAALAASDDPVPHLPSVERWRKGSRAQAYDPNAEASRQELRTFVCAQCHVEYYCATKETLFFPWSEGLKVERIEAAYDRHEFPDGSPFFDFKHAETDAPSYKAQHPEFELWSQGTHARSGVSCADCHMPYERQGAMKVSSHWVRSPMHNINRSCQVCHHTSESELREKVATIQGRTTALIERSATAMTDMLDAIVAAKTAGATPEDLAPLHKLQRQATWRLDFVSSENSKGFHAGQEAARILAESIDYSRQAELAARRWMQAQPPTTAGAQSAE